MKRGGPLKRSTPLRAKTGLSRSPMKRGKPKGRARADEPLASVCRVASPVCSFTPSERHHKLRRSQGGTDDASNTVDACSPCHSYIHAHPAWAYDEGWLLRRPPEGTEPR